MHNIHQIQTTIVLVIFGVHKWLHTSTLWRCVDLCISTSHLSQIHLFFPTGWRNVSKCWWVLSGDLLEWHVCLCRPHTGVTTCPTNCWNATGASPGSWFLLVVCLFHDNLVAREVVCRKLWCYANIWKPQLYNRRREKVDYSWCLVLLTFNHVPFQST